MPAPLSEAEKTQRATAARQHAIEEEPKSRCAVLGLTVLNCVFWQYSRTSRERARTAFERWGMIFIYPDVPRGGADDNTPPPPMRRRGTVLLSRKIAAVLTETSYVCV
jgi:hypothetical protein